MGSIKGKWTTKVDCASNAEAQVMRDQFRRKGMLARIRRTADRFQSGKPIGGHWIVQARIPKKGLNTYRQNSKTLPLILVKWPVVISNTTRTQTGRDFRGKPTYEESTTKTAGIEVRAMRLAEDEIPDAIAAEQTKIDEEIGGGE